VNGAEQIAQWIRNDPLRWKLLAHVRELNLPDCWIGAGFVRNAVWCILHGKIPALTGDVDVIWFDRSNFDETEDRALERRLAIIAPEVAWSVNNQARMHIENGDSPYLSSTDAMRFWPETATAVAVRRTDDDRCEVIAPLGLDDLLTLKLRPAGDFASGKRQIFDSRVNEKGWLSAFPKLELLD
jgi:hypothetical protein